MYTREYTPDQSFRGSIDTMDEIEDFKTYIAEYFSWKVLRHGEAVFTELDDAEGFSLRCKQKRLQIFFEPSAGHDGSVRPADQEYSIRIRTEKRRSVS